MLHSERLLDSVQTFFGGKGIEVQRASPPGIAILKRFLAHKDLDVNVQTKRGFTAYMFAAQAGKIEVLDLLQNHHEIDTEVFNR